MDINATLLGQAITFGLLVVFTMKFVWPPLIGAMEERQKRIADGLAAADRGKHELELAQERGREILHDAKEHAAEIIAQAQKRAAEIIDEAKGQAKEEGERLIVAAKAEIAQESNRAREKLRGQVVQLAVAGAGRVLSKEIDAKAHEKLLSDLVSNL